MISSVSYRDRYRDQDRDFVRVEGFNVFIINNQNLKTEIYINIPLFTPQHAHFFFSGQLNTKLQSDLSTVITSMKYSRKLFFQKCTQCQIGVEQSFMLRLIFMIFSDCVSIESISILILIFDG